MPRRRVEQATEKVCVMLFSGDMRDMMELYPRQGASSVIRQLVRNHINAKRGFEKPPLPQVEVEL